MKLGNVRDTFTFSAIQITSVAMTSTMSDGDEPQALRLAIAELETAMSETDRMLALTQA